MPAVYTFYLHKEWPRPGSGLLKKRGLEKSLEREGLEGCTVSIKLRQKIIGARVVKGMEVRVQTPEVWPIAVFNEVGVLVRGWAWQYGYAANEPFDEPDGTTHLFAESLVPNAEDGLWSALEET